MNTIEKVLEFHEAFGCEIGLRPHLPQDPAEECLVHGAAKLRQALTHFQRGSAMQGATALRLALITEELAELAEAGLYGNVAGALDALVDLRYVLDGTVIAFGFHIRAARAAGRPIFDAAFNRVHTANMAKLRDGKAVHDANGKVVKPPGWVAPDLSDLVV